MSYAEGADSSEVSGMPPQMANKIDKDQSINLATESPVRPGWIFEGWKSDISGNSTVYQPGQTFIMPGQNVVMTAVWKERSQDVKLDLTYHLNDGSGLIKVDPDGGYVTNSNVEVKSLGDLSWSVPANYRFIGWTGVLNPSADDVRYQKGDIYIMGDNNGHLYAQWLKLCTVTFISNGGTAVDPIRDLESGSTIAGPSVNRSGYTFLGWFTDDGTFQNKWNFDSDKVTEDMTLYASWRRNSSGGGGSSGGGDPKPTPPKPTDPAVPDPTDPVVTPPTTPPYPLPELPPGYYVKEENNMLIVYSPEGIPLGYLLANDMSGTIYPLDSLPKTGDNEKGLHYAMFISAGSFLAISGLLLKRKKEEDQF